MSKYIHFGKWNKNYKYIILSTIFAFFTNIIFGYTFNDFLDEIKLFTQYKNEGNGTGNHNNTDNNNGNNHIIINYIFRYLGLILFSFILYKCELYNKSTIFRRNSKDNIPELTSLRLIYNNSEENTKNKIIVSPSFILLIMIIMVLQEISEEIFYKSSLRTLDFWMLELPLLSYFNLKYFKFRIYSHHKLVIYFNLIICSILRIIYLILFIHDGNRKDNLFNYINKSWGVIPLGIITYLIIMISSFALSEIKILMQYKYISPIKLLIVYGIVGAIITTIIGLISTFIKCNKINSYLDMRICEIEDDNKAF